MTLVAIGDARLFVKVEGHGPPLLLMHGGPGGDHTTMLPFRRLADRFTLVFYDHRCNGRSRGAPVESMTWENLTADADGIREHLGFERWAVLGHSFGGNVALEYALRYPERLTHLILLDSGADARWPMDHGPELLAVRGFSSEIVELARRFYRGRITPEEYLPSLMRLGDAYFYHPSPAGLLREMLHGGWRTKPRGEPLIYAGQHLLDGWSVMDRLRDIETPTLVLAGREDFLYPPEHQMEVALGVVNGTLRIIERAGHNPHYERPADVMKAVTRFILGEPNRPMPAPPPTAAVNA